MKRTFVLNAVLTGLLCASQISYANAAATNTVTNKDGVQEITCDSYYKTTTGTYYGAVYKYGVYQSTYNSTTKKTTTTFIVKSTDVSMCKKAQLTAPVKKTKTATCPTGQTGAITYYRMVAYDKNGNTVYPNGDNWLLDKNTCTKNAVAQPTPLPANISLNSSNLINSTDYKVYLDSLIDSGWRSSASKHKLTLNIDDLSVDKYNGNRVGIVIDKYKQLVGSNANIEIKFPTTVNKYIGRGNGDISAGSIADKTISIDSITLEGYSVRFAYFKTVAKNVKENRKEIIPLFE